MAQRHLYKNTIKNRQERLLLINMILLTMVTAFRFVNVSLKALLATFADSFNLKRKV